MHDIRGWCYPSSGNVVSFTIICMKLLSKVFNEKKHSFILRDDTSDLSGNRSSDFVNNETSCGFIPIKSRPTLTIDCFVSLINNILTNVALCEKVEVLWVGILLTDISDHFPFLYKLKLDNIWKTTRKC